MPKRIFTEQQIEELKQNPYVTNVTPQNIYFSLAFKKKAVEEAARGKMSTRIFADAGFSAEVLGVTRIYNTMRRWKLEAASEEGLHDAHWKSAEKQRQAFAEAELSKKRTKTAIAELQKKVIHLEQQIAFLKKTQQLKDSNPT